MSHGVMFFFAHENVQEKVLETFPRVRIHFREKPQVFPVPSITFPFLNRRNFSIWLRIKRINRGTVRFKNFQIVLFRRLPMCPVFKMIDLKLAKETACEWLYRILRRILCLYKLTSVVSLTLTLQKVTFVAYKCLYWMASLVKTTARRTHIRTIPYFTSNITSVGHVTTSGQL